MQYYLVVGGTGVMGTAAIKAIRSVFGENAVIVANWYGKEDTGEAIEGADHTVFGDITENSCLEKIKSINSGSYDYLHYATALGDVGFAIKESSPEQIAHSNRLSFDPILQLESELNIGTIVTYSTFYSLKHQLCSYGAMGYSKEAIEKWTLEEGKSKRLCIRAGLFESQSSRGIKLLLRKNAKKIDNIKDPLLRSYFEGVPSKDGIENFLNGIINEEKEKYGDSPTTPETLFQAHLELLKHEGPPFINVCGKMIWRDNEAQILD